MLCRLPASSDPDYFPRMHEIQPQQAQPNQAAAVYKKSAQAATVTSGSSSQQQQQNTLAQAPTLVPVTAVHGASKSLVADVSSVASSR